MSEITKNKESRIIEYTSVEEWYEIVQPNASFKIEQNGETAFITWNSKKGREILDEYVYSIDNDEQWKRVFMLTTFAFDSNWILKNEVENEAIILKQRLKQPKLTDNPEEIQEEFDKLKHISESLLKILRKNDPTLR